MFEYFYHEYRRIIYLFLSLFIVGFWMYFTFVSYPNSIQGKVSLEAVEALRVFLSQPGANYIIGFFGTFVVAIGFILWWIYILFDIFYEYEPPELEFNVLKGKARWLL